MVCFSSTRKEHREIHPRTCGRYKSGKGTDNICDLPLEMRRGLFDVLDVSLSDSRPLTMLIFHLDYVPTMWFWFIIIFRESLPNTLLNTVSKMYYDVVGIYIYNHISSLFCQKIQKRFIIAFNRTSSRISINVRILLKGIMKENLINSFRCEMW